MNHTPGPWRAFANNVFDWRIAPADGGTQIAVLSGMPEDRQPLTAEANARLIAAAPELLEALREMVIRLTPEVTPSDGRRDVVLRATAAIAKAEGRE